MSTKFADKIFRMIFIFVFVVGTMAIPGGSTKALGNDQSISALPEEDVIYAFNWPLGVLLMLEIDDPGTSQTPDYATSHVVLGPNNYEKIEFGGTFDIQPGYLVTVSDGNIARQHTITHLAVTNVDMDADTISGIANPGSNIFVSTNCDANGCANRNLIADENGNWLADFASVSDPSQGDGVYDVRLASGGTVHEYDEDWDSTRIPWIMWPPTIGVDVDIDRVQGWDWPLGATVDFEIDDPLTSENPDYVNSVTVEAADWDPNLMYFVFYTNDYDVKPGDVVTATDGNITKQLIVTHFRITGTDLDLDIVYGIADPSQEVKIWTYNHDGKSITREAIADSNGNWSANFGIPGNDDSEQETLDIRNGSGFDSFVGDEDWDCTRSMWDVPNPPFGVSVNDNQVVGWQWTLGSILTIEIDDPLTETDPDYSDTATVGPIDWDPNQTRFVLNTNDYDLKTGDIVEVTDGTITKQLLVTDFKITDVDLDNDIVHGMADPNQDVKVSTCWQNDPCVNRDETADQDGNWTTNFAVPGEQDWEQETADLQAGSWIDSSVNDEDGDSIMFGWYEPIITVATVNIDIYGNHIFASDWIVGSDVTVSFDIPGSEEEWDYSKTVTVPEGWGAWCQFQIDIDAAIFRIASGQVVRITDGTTTRLATIPNFSVTSEDPTADTISGIALAGSTVDLFAVSGSDGSGDYRRHAVVDSEGQWFADFAHPGTGSDEQGILDVIPGAGFFWVSQPINDFVGIKFMWDFGPYFHVFPEEERVETYVWPIGANLTLTIDDPTTQENPDLTRTQENLDWQTNFENLGTILPGFTVSITDGLVTKTHIVTDLAVTGADSQTDTVTGTAEPDSMVNLSVCGDNDCVNRHVSAGDNRIWLANLSVPGVGSDEQDILDIHPGDEGDVQQADIDGDTTALRWRAPNPKVVASPDDAALEGSDWPIDSIVTVQIGNPSQADYTTTTTLNPPDQDHAQPWFRLDLSSVYDLQPGEMVTAFDAETTKQLIVVNRNITLIDMVADTITGIGDQNITFVVLWACDDSGCVGRRKDVTPGEGWSVNFALPGELDWENAILDIQPGTTGGIYQNDEDGDGTSYAWSLNQPPHADLGPDLVTDEGTTLMLDASASSDPEAGLLTYEWDLDNDGEYDDAVGVTTTKSFPDNGNYIISLKVTDEYGASDFDTLEVTVNNISPLVDIQQISVNGLSITGCGFFTDPGADMWAAVVNYGDGSGVQPLALNPDKSFLLNHTYIANGNYTVEVCVSDDDSASGCDQAQVTVTLNRPPVAEAGGPYVSYEGLTVTLNASLSTDPDNNIVLCEWDFDNDGQFDDAVGKRPKFKAADNGVYIVRVRVTDAGGLSSVDSSTVTVKNLPPIITSLTFNSSVRVGVRLNTFATFTDAGINDTHTATWKWGDGTTSSGTVSGYSVSGSHVYAKPGIYLVTITVKDKDGGTASAYKLILVLPKR